METIKKKSKGYFTTGEFAKLCNVKKQTMTISVFSSLK